MKVLSVASEIYPLVKTGGLADVAGALPTALAREGVETRSLVPGYAPVLQGLERAEAALSYADLFGGPATLVGGRSGDLDILAIDAPHLYRRPGGPYADTEGRDWPDNAQRFAALCRVAADIGLGGLAGFAPDVVQAHDWQAGLTPAYLHYAGRRPATVMTVHNLAFQGRFPAELLPALGLPPESFTIEGAEYFGAIGFLKAGLAYADHITTVSPTYAEEIRTPEGGMGLDGLLRKRSAVLSGILNGIDDAVWNPASDPHLAASFTTRTLAQRRANKKALVDRFGVRIGGGELLFGVISRLSWQKGLDLLLAALPRLRAEGAALVLLGSGDAGLEQGFQAAAATSDGGIGVRIGYDEELAHLIQGGADALIVPSRFEPCGLTQLYALRYGAPPVVARVGGLADTIIDANEMAVAARAATGVQFAPVTQDALESALARTAALWRSPQAWRRMQARGMATEVGWSRSAARYAALYRNAVAERGVSGR